MKYISCFFAKEIQWLNRLYFPNYPKHIQWLNGLKCIQEHIIQPRFASRLITIFEGLHENCREVIAFPLNLLFFEGRKSSTMPQILGSALCLGSTFSWNTPTQRFNGWCKKSLSIKFVLCSSLGALQETIWISIYT